jgi:hypothetical protein
MSAAREAKRSEGPKGPSTREPGRPTRLRYDFASRCKEAER